MYVATDVCNLEHKHVHVYITHLDAHIQTHVQISYGRFKVCRMQATYGEPCIKYTIPYVHTCTCMCTVHNYTNCFQLTSMQRYSFERHSSVLLTVGYHMSCMSAAACLFLLPFLRGIRIRPLVLGSPGVASLYVQYNRMQQ